MILRPPRRVVNWHQGLGLRCSRAFRQQATRWSSAFRRPYDGRLASTHRRDFCEYREIPPRPPRISANMQPELAKVLDDVLASRAVSADAMHAAMLAVMDGRCQPAETAALLTALAVQGETPDVLAGAARAMRDRAAQIPTHRAGLLDTCGTGGDKLHT